MDEINELISASKEALKNLPTGVLPEKYKDYKFKTNADPFEVGDIVLLKKGDKNDYRILTKKHDIDGAMYYSLDLNAIERGSLEEDAAMTEQFSHISSTDPIIHMYNTGLLLDYLKNNNIVISTPRYESRSSNNFIDTFYNILESTTNGSRVLYRLNSLNRDKGHTGDHSTGNIFRYFRIPTEKELDDLEQLIKEQEENKARVLASLTESFSNVYPDTSEVVTVEEYISGASALSENDRCIRFYRSVKYIGTIYFDEVTVSNRNGNSHTISEVYVRLEFKEDGSVYSLKGTRSFQTVAEYYSTYLHSHFSGGVVNQWSELCLGNTDMQFNLGDLMQRFHDIQLESFLHRFKNYLTWESLDGGPYRKLEQIHINNNNVSSGSKLGYDNILNKITDIKDIIEFKKGKYHNIVRLKNNINTKIKIGKAVLEYYVDDPDSVEAYFAYINKNTGEYVSINARTVSQLEEIRRGMVEDTVHKNRSFTFKGKQIKGEIDAINPEEGVENIELVRVLNKNSFVVFEREFNSSINEFIKIKELKINYDDESSKSEQHSIGKQEHTSAAVTSS
jgi:hypothetical protein